MVLLRLFELLEQQPHLFVKTIREWKKAHALLARNNPSSETIKSLVLLLFKTLGYRCSQDNSSGTLTSDWLIEDPLCLTAFQLRFIPCPSTPIKLQDVQKPVGAMEAIRRHIVIFVLIYNCPGNDTRCYTRPADVYMHKKSPHYQFLDGVRLVNKVYFMA